MGATMTLTHLSIKQDPRKAYFKGKSTPFGRFICIFVPKMRVIGIKEVDFVVQNLGYAQVVHHWGNKDISSPFVRIYYVIKGRAWLHLPGCDVEATPGHMYMVPPHVPHDYECDPGFGFYYLFATPQMRTDIFDLYEFPVEVRSNEAARLLFENYCSLYPFLHLPSETARAFDQHPAYNDYTAAFRQMQPFERLQLYGLTLIIFSYFLKRACMRNEVADARMTDLIMYIHNHVNERITVEMLAERACLTKSYLIRAFKAALGISPLQFINRKKVQEAQTLLLTTDKSVTEISHALGVPDESYFIRMFRKALGVTPQEYRTQLR